MPKIVFSENFYRPQENPAWCGPAVIQMILAVSDSDIENPQPEIAGEVCLPWWGTAQEMMFAYLSRFFGNIDFKDNASIEDIKQRLNSGYTVVVNWWDNLDASEESPEDGHYSLIVDYDDEAQTLTLADPISSRGIWRIAQKDFENLWFDFLDPQRKKQVKGWMLWVDPKSKI